MQPTHPLAKYDAVHNPVAQPVLPLSEAQKGIWLGQSLNPDSPMYNAAEVIDIGGVFHVDQFVTALRRTLLECDAMHTVYRQDGDNLQQAVKITEPQIDIVDLSNASDPQQRADEMMRGLLAQTADLARGSLFRQVLFKLGDERYKWYQQVHHIAADGYAFNLIAQRVIERYNHAVARGAQTPDETTNARSYRTLANVVDEDRQYHASQHHDADRHFWQQYMQGLVQPVSFNDTPSPISDRAVHAPALIPPERMQAIKHLCQQRGVGWPNFFMSLVAYLLYRQRAAGELTLGIPIMGRMGSVSLRVPAMVMNIIPLRIRLDRSSVFSELLDQVAGAMRATAPHQRYRYEHLRRDLQAVGGERRLFGPVVNVMPFDRAMHFAGTTCRSRTLSAGPVEDISFNFIVDADGSLRFDLDANPLRYTQRDIEYLQAQTLDQIDQLIAEPDAPLRADLGKLSYLQGPAFDTPVRPVTTLFAEQARQRPHATALVDGHNELSYAQLHAACEQLARRLKALDIEEGDLVALALPRGKEAVTTSLALLMIGAAYVFIDPHGPELRNRTILDDAQPRMLVYADQPSPAGTDIPAIAFVELVADNPALDGVVEPFAPASTSDRSAAYVIYTSGSTGKPKGVVVSHQALAEFVVGAQQTYGIAANDRVLQFAPLHFDASVEEIFVTLCSGACLVVRDDDMIASVPGFIEQCDRWRISVLDLPTAYWHELVYYCASAGLMLPTRLRCVIIGGEAAQAERLAQWHAVNPNNARLLNTYGPSEATVVATCAQLNAQSPLSIGTPLPGRDVFVLDVHGHLCPTGVAGELVLAGAGLANGYLNGETFSHQPFRTLHLPFLNAPQRVYHTGDRVCLTPSGDIDYRGRIDDEIKISGHRINPLEIEAAILRLPDVDQAALVAVGQADGSKFLAAFVVSNKAWSLVQLRRQLASHLPAAMLPTSLAIVESLPKSTAGKVDRRRLVEMCGESSAHSTTIAAASLSNHERLIIDTWQQVLGQRTISADDDFFLLGGQSLQTIQVANRLSAALNDDIPVTLLFEHPTVRQLAAALEDRQGTVHEDVRRQVEHDSRLDTPVVAQYDTPPANGLLSDNVATVLLTGANGFVGTQLLYQLLEQTGARVVCLLRGSDEHHARQKLRDALHAANLPYDRYAERIEVVVADLERTGLGLSEPTRQRLSDTVDAIWHNAAVTSVMRSYRSLRAANLDSTRALLEIATPRRVPMHYVSTIAVGAMNAAPGYVLPEDFVAWHAGLQDGYQQSKWASERLLAQAAEQGQPVAIYRLGRVSGHSISGYFNRGDLAWRILQAAIHHGCAPEFDFAEPWTPVDQVALAMVSLARQTTNSGVFNCVPSQRLTLQQMFAWLRELDYPLRSAPLSAWLAQLRNADDPDHQALAAFFEQRAALAGSAALSGVANAALERMVDTTDLPMPSVERMTFANYMHHATQQGWIKPAAARTVTQQESA